MAILGYNVKDTAGSSTMVAGRLLVSKFTLASAQTLQELHAWFSGIASDTVRVVIYADSSGVPGARVAMTGIKTLTGGDQEAAETGFSVALAAGAYWIGTYGVTGAGSSLVYTSLSGPFSRINNAGADPPPNPFGTPSVTSTGLTVCAWAVVGTPAAVPVADFTGTPLTGTTPVSVAFTDTSTNTPTSWAWTFGDGGASSSQNPSHSYTTPGTYTVVLVATNSAGSNTKTRTGYIVVADQPRPVRVNTSAGWVDIADHTAFVSGTGNPTAAVGATGAIYLDTATGRVWGPKAAGAWPGTSFGVLDPIPATDGQWVKSASGLPVWAAITQADVSGVVPDAQLPARLGVGAVTVTDWNNALSNGWYGSVPGAANQPYAAYFVGIVSQSHLGTSYIRQVLYELNTDRIMVRRRDGGAWQPWTPVSPIVYSATPPASPADGDLWFMTMDSSGGITWMFRYRAAATNGYRWEFVGGGDYTYFVDTAETRNTVVLGDLTTVGPQFTAPRAGIYHFEFSALMTQGAAPSYSAGAGMTVGDLHATGMLNGSGSGWEASISGIGQATMTAAQLTKAQYFTQASTVTFSYRRLFVRPVCVS